MTATRPRAPLAARLRARLRRPFRARALALALALLPLACQPPGPGTLYTLAPESVLLDGCFGDCLCPVRITEDLYGHFVLTELPILAPGPRRLFSVTDLAWRAVRGDEEIVITGDGMYTLDPLEKSHRLTLRLRFDGGPTEEFDSGLVPGGEEFPEIAIRVSMNGEVECFDTVFDLRALPVESPGCQDNTDCGDDELCQKPSRQCAERGSCMARPEVCPLVEDPVCGCDGRTYSNFCQAATAGVSVDFRGVCGEPECRETAECPDDRYCAKAFGACAEAGVCALRPDACLLVIDPVCGCDGNTYGNSCEAAMAGVSVAFKGVCEPECRENADCAEGEYCETPFGTCGGDGRCEMRPEACLQVFNPVCGCDGVTYPNACEAAAAGVALAGVGECAGPL